MSMTKDIQTIQHSASGASIQVHPFGATVLSYNNGKKEILFVSESALLDGSKPVRGGIPLVFPIFGPPSNGSTMPQHGFARRNYWTQKQTFDTTTSAGISFELDFQDVSAGIGEQNPWANGDFNCKLQLELEFGPEQLTTKLSIRNTGSKAFPFQTLLHTYYTIQGKAALDPSQCYVKGLERYKLIDKVGNAIDKHPIIIEAEVDRVYDSPTKQLDVTIGVGNNEAVRMTAMGEVDEVSVPVSCVVWNPYVEKAANMSDFGNDQYQEMICVEPGILTYDGVLEATKQASLTQTVFPL